MTTEGRGNLRDFLRFLKFNLLNQNSLQLGLNLSCFPRGLYLETYLFTFPKKECISVTLLLWTLILGKIKDFSYSGNPTQIFVYILTAIGSILPRSNSSGRYEVMSSREC